MKIKINQKLNEKTSVKLTEDSLSDVIDDFGKETAKEVKEIAQTFDKLGKLQIESEPWAESANGDLESALSASLSQAQRIQRELAIDLEDAEEAGDPDLFDPTEYGFAANVLVVGPAGTGKTARIKKWAKSQKPAVTVIAKDAKTMDPTDLGGIISRLVNDKGEQTNQATKLRNTEFDVLDTPNTILFLDELNRAPDDVAGSLLTLIQDHVVPSNEGNGTKFLSGFMFTVAAVNPATGEASQGYRTQQLDMAMKTRFGKVSVEYDNLQQLEYLRKYYKRLIEDPRREKEDRIANWNRYQIAKKLLLSPNFHFDSEEEEAELSDTSDSALNYRSLTQLLNNCDGTKEDFLNKWPRFCNPHKTEMVEDILDDYLDYDDSDDEGYFDIDDKANSVFENPLKQNRSIWDDVEKYL